MDGNGNNLLLPLDSLVRVNRIQTQLEKLTKWQQEQLKKAIEQYDAILDREDITPESALNVVMAKTKALSTLGTNSARISLAIERERQESHRTQHRLLQSRKLAMRIYRASPKAASAKDIESYRPPKVRMFLPGCDFKATVGLGSFQLKAPPDFVEEIDDFIPS